MKNHVVLFLILLPTGFLSTDQCNEPGALPTSALNRLWTLTCPNPEDQPQLQLYLRDYHSAFTGGSQVS